MAKKFRNEKDFLIIEINNQEAKYLGFGTPSGCICMHCNNIIDDNIYYICALNDVMDKQCMEEWLKDAIRYKEDIPIEERYFRYYGTLLNL